MKLCIILNSNCNFSTKGTNEEWQKGKKNTANRIYNAP